MIVGTLGKALGSYGAYVCASRELVELLVNTARPFIYSTALPPPVGRRRARGAGPCSTTRPGMVEQLRRNAAILREALGAEGLGDRRLADADRPGDRRRRAPRDGRSASARSRAASSRRRSARRPCPTGTSRLRLTVMANHRADELRRAARVIGRAAARARASATRLASTRRCRGSPRRVSRARRLRHRHRHRGRQDGRRGGDRPRPRPARGERVAVFKPAVTGLDDGRRARPRAAAPGRAAREQADDEIAPYRYGPPVSPHLGAELAGERIDPSGCATAARAPRRRRRPARRRGRRRLPRPADAGLPGPRPRARARPAGRDRRLARARDDQPHPADDRGGPRGGARGRRGRAHALARRRRPSSSARTARRSRGSAGSRS